MKKNIKEIKKLDILDESDKRLRTISDEVTFPLSDKDKSLMTYAEFIKKYGGF